ncbi:hypothetical protein [Dyadobacter sp. 3J3]|uniref:hypothetical protein n=1 Tax=Dyadobacter sp. 3J3 TaxID=2606600 RepID=UPI00135B18AC|nr:hypothetical protein [Dyadobacter sp. 3J3]
MRLQISKRQRTASFLLLLWALICLSNVVFRHAHRLPNGSIISHVHPYTEFASKCPFPNHHHSQSELNWLDCLSNIPFDSFTSDVSFEIALLKKPALVNYPYIEKQADQKLPVLFLRGPPVS